VTTPRVNTIKRGGARFYVNPESSEKVPGVTSVISMLPKEFLRYWAAKMVAQEAVADLGALVSITMRDPEAAIDYLKRAPDRNTKKAADTGSAAHDFFERLARSETIPDRQIPADVKPFVAHFRDFLDVCQPEYHFLEETVWSDSHGYAGSFDAFATIFGEKVWVDNKTTRSGVHEEVGIQLAAYRYADHIIREDGGRVPMPQADGGAVLHVRPEGWKLVPVRADEQMFEVFLHLREVFRYEREIKSTVVGRPVASSDGAAPVGFINKPKEAAK
jgi:hypothetical protein